MRNIRSDISAVWSEVVTPTLLVVWITTTIIVAFAGPFGTYNSLDLGGRFAYWGSLITVSIVLAVMFRMFWRVKLHSSSPLVEDVFVLTSLAVVFGPIVSFVNHFFWPDTNQLASWPFASALTFLIGCCAVALRHLVQTHNSKVDPVRDRLLDRIGAPSEARLCKISSDNHHIRISTTDRQEFRVLMRLRDAIADINVEPGFCVHRSHWVALSEIAKVEVSDGREIVQLNCGAEVPVGPKYRTNLIEAGILND